MSSCGVNRDRGIRHGNNPQHLLGPSSEINLHNLLEVLDYGTHRFSWATSEGFIGQELEVIELSGSPIQYGEGSLTGIGEWV